MASEWRETTLGEFVRLQRGHDLTAEERKPGDYPVMGSAGQNGTHGEFIASGPGVVIGRSGASMGTVHFMPDDYWPHNTCLYVTDFLGNDPRFAFYLLGSLDLASYNSGSAQPSLNRNYIYTKPIRFPPLEEQRTIAEILGAFDDRIDNLRQTNATLEAMAQALFKSRFVDFDGISPEYMQDSELGLIPKRWRVASLDSIANYLNGLVLQKFPPESETEFLPVIKIAQLRTNSTNGADKASTKIKSEYIVENGEVLFSALNQNLFKITSREVPKWFYYFATRQHLEDFRAIAASKATTMGHIQRRHLTAAQVVVPPLDEMVKYDAVIAPLFEQKIRNALQARTLAHLRDILLPRLISGKLRIPDTQSISMEKAP